MKPRIRPVVWAPPPRSRRTPSGLHARIRRISLPARGEDVVVDAQGRLITGLEDGRIMRVAADGKGKPELLANTGGRPLGIELDREGRILVCDARRGLFRLDPDTRRLETLVDAREHGLGFCNNAAVAQDGTIYFSDSSQRFGIEYWRGELLAHSGTGRLLRLSPGGELQVVLEGLEFANGVALSADESFVAIAETSAYRVSRLWLRGPRAGQRDLLIENLPGFPDNLSSDDAGNIWVAVAGPRNPLLDFLLPRNPLLRRAVWKIPYGLLPGAPRVAHVIAVNGEGRVVRDFGGRSREFHMVTGMRVHGNELYLASLEERALGVLSL